MARIDIGNGTVDTCEHGELIDRCFDCNPHLGYLPVGHPEWKKVHGTEEDWITASLARLAPELQTNHPPLSPFERLSLEMFRGAFELIALIADGSAARGGNQARIEELCARFGIELPASATSTATESPRQPEQSAAEET